MPNTRKVQLRPSVPRQEDPPNPAPCGLDSNADALVHFAAVAARRLVPLNVSSAPRCCRSSTRRLERPSAGSWVAARLPQSARRRLSSRAALAVHGAPHDFRIGLEEVLIQRSANRISGSQMTSHPAGWSALSACRWVAGATYFSLASMVRNPSISVCPNSRGCRNPLWLQATHNTNAVAQ